MVIGHYSNDDSIKMAYSLAMREGVAESRDLQVLLVGAENTGKSSLISSFLGEEFVEKQAATEAVEVDPCRIYCKDWTRISHSDKTDLIHHQFVDQLKEKAMDMVDTTKVALLSRSEHVKSLDSSIKNLDIPSKNQFVDQLKGKVVKDMTPVNSINHVAPSGTTITSLPPACNSGSSGHLPEPHMHPDYV